MAISPQSVNKDELAIWWGVVSSSTNLAGCCAPWLALLTVTVTERLIVSESAWRGVFWLIGLSCLLWATVMLTCLTNSSCHQGNSGTAASTSSQGVGDLQEVQKDNEDGAKANQESALAGAPSAGLLSQITRLFAVLSPTNCRILCFCALLHFSTTFLRFTISNWAPLLLRHYSELYSNDVVNWFISFNEFGGVLGSFLVGTLAKLNSARNTRWRNPRLPIIIGEISVASALLVFLALTISSRVSTYALLLTGLVLGLVIFSAIALCGIVVTELAPPSLCGTSYAFSSLAANVGALLAGYPFTCMANQVGWSGAFLATALLSGSCVIPAFVLDV